MFLTFDLLGQDVVKINLVARSKATHQNVALEAKDLEIRFDGAPQAISTFEGLGCRQDSLSTAAVILSSAEVLQSTMGLDNPGGHTDSGARQALARKIIDKLPRDLDVEAYSWAPRLVPIRILQQDGNIETLSIIDALKVFNRQMSVIGTGATVAENHGGSIARWSDLELMANHLGDRPGRKALIWYCTNFSDRADGYPISADGHDLWTAALMAMNRENIAVYPIDCSMTVSQPKPNFRKLLKSEPMISGSQKDTKVDHSEAVIASYTGGRFYAGMNRLEAAIRDGLSDSRCSYEIAWTLPGGSRTHGRQQSISRIHLVQVNSHRPDIELLYPEVYLEAAIPTSQTERLKLAESGLTYRLPLHAIPVTASWAGARARIQYRTKPLTFLPDKDGKLHSALDILLAYYDLNGARIKAGRHFEVKLTTRNGDLDTFEAKDQSLNDDSEIPPGATELRVVVREQSSGKMGTAYISIPH